MEHSTPPAAIACADAEDIAIHPAPTASDTPPCVMRRLRQVRAALVDMDGTLVDSDASVERAWLGWADEFGVDPAAVRPIMHGRPADQTVRLLLPHLDDVAVAAAAQRQLELQYSDLDDVVAAPGADLLLTTLSRLRFPWAVVTSADTTLARARLQTVGIEPPLLVTVDDVGVGKPDPEGYLSAAAQLGVAPERCLVVEDSAVGVAAGRAAGALTAGLRGVASDVAVDDLAQLAHLLWRESGRF